MVNIFFAFTLRQNYSEMKFNIKLLMHLYKPMGEMLKLEPEVKNETWGRIQINGL